LVLKLLAKASNYKRIALRRLKTVNFRKLRKPISNSRVVRSFIKILFDSARNSNDQNFYLVSGISFVVAKY